MNLTTVRSLRWQLVAVMCMAYIIGAVATEIVGYSMQYQNLHKQLVTRAKADATILAGGTAANLHFRSKGNLQFIQYFITSMTQAQSVDYAAVYRSDLHLLTYTPPLRSPRILPQSDSFRKAWTESMANGDVEGFAPIITDTNFGIALVKLSGSSVQTELHSSLLADSILRGAGLVIFFLLSLAIAQYILGPLAGLARAAYSIRHGNMGARTPVGGRAELATVAAAFNEMADALEERIAHLSFLAVAASVLPRTFRDREDVTPTLEEFCRQLRTYGAGLLPRGEPTNPDVWYQAHPDDEGWRTVAPLVASARTPVAEMQGGYAVMTVPVLGDTLFLTLRAAGKPFTQEEQQVITNFAYQVGIAADNARLFEAQQEALQVKDQFLSIVSHELRTPLTTIKGYAQMLRKKLENDASGQRFAVNIDAQVSRLSRLVDDLLDVTRFSRGQFEVKQQFMDIRPVLEDTVARFRVVSPKHEFSLHLDSGSFEGMWDRDRLEQVMNNLVGNAVKYSPEGGGVEIITRHEGDRLVVAVRDHGLGIPDRDQKLLFERFFRGTAEGGDVKGLGLGLYVTRRIVEAHGGDVRVWSKLHEGSEFSFSLPLVRAAVAARPVQIR